MFNGVWATDSSEGYVIKVRIDQDSAYLSRSPNFEEVPYTFLSTNDSIVLENKLVNKRLSWEFDIIGGEKIILSNNKDSLMLFKVQ